MRKHPLPNGISLKGKTVIELWRYDHEMPEITVFPRGKIRDGCFRFEKNLLRRKHPLPSGISLKGKPIIQLRRYDHEMPKIPSSLEGR